MELFVKDGPIPDFQFDAILMRYYSLALCDNDTDTVKSSRMRDEAKSNGMRDRRNIGGGNTG